VKKILCYVCIVHRMSLKGYQSRFKLWPMGVVAANYLHSLGLFLSFEYLFCLTEVTSHMTNFLFLGYPGSLLWTK